MWLSDKWQDFELLDCSRGEKLERWGDYILVRPDRRPSGTRPGATRAGAAATANTPAARPAAGPGTSAAARKLADRLRGAPLQHKAHEFQAHGHFPGAGRKLGLYNAQNKVGGQGD